MKKRLVLLLLLSLTLAACAGLLGIRPRDTQRPFEHHAHSVKGIACVTCHQGIAKAGDEGPLHLPGKDVCVSCHAKPHDSRSCEQCHGQSHVREEDRLAREHLTFAHDRHVPRLGGQCVPCHAAAGDLEQPTMRPPMAQCFGCHNHRDQWAVRDCDSCHKDLPRELVKPASHVVHEGNFIREHGVRAASSRDLCATCHSEAQCASCHGITVAALPWKLELGNPQMTGLSNLHRAGFKARHAEESRANPGLCTTCHSEERFCGGCHEKRRVSGVAALGPAKNPHPANWVRARGGEHGRAARMDPGSCATCHGGAGEALCVGCHRVGGPGGNPHGPGYASRLDPRRDQPCIQCHGGAP